uniref:N-acetyltransferase domain-containing protein n=1 Tax=uncultured bacterium contig00027 TaxID=1181516 RepID=A0A806KJT0_9BACT|nr:hypothetical protein [uncultured bacterium contig00027]
MALDDTNIREICFPEGFFMRPYEEGDGTGWCECCIDGGLDVNEASEEVFEKKMLHDKSVNPKNIFFLISPLNEIAGTVTYQYTGDKDSANIHMVGIKKSYRGKHLALPMNLYVIQKIFEDGKKKIFLTTDDWRLPAIKVYLNAGFKPVYHMPDMEERWNDVMRKLSGA